jgi:hypothetical protein
MISDTTPMQVTFTISALILNSDVSISMFIVKYKKTNYFNNWNQNPRDENVFLEVLFESIRVIHGVLVASWSMKIF